MFRHKLIKRIDYSKKAWPDFDAFMYRNCLLEDTTVYDNVAISDTMMAPLFIAASNGLFVFCLSKSEDENVIKQDLEKFKTTYYLPNNGLFIFVRTDEYDYFYNDNGQLIEIEQPLDRFEALYNNTLRPQIDLNYIKFQSTYDMLFEPDLPDEYKDDNGEAIIVANTGETSYVATLVPTVVLSRIDQAIEKAQQTVIQGDVMISESGQRYKKFSTHIKFLGYSYRDDWYPIADDDPLRFLIITVLTGWLGGHKYYTGEIFQGLFYTLTFGGFGIFYLFDILSIAMGTYSVKTIDYSEDANGKLQRYKSKVFLDKLDAWWCGMIALLVGAVIAYVSIKFGYMSIFKTINEAIANQVQQSIENAVQTLDDTTYTN